MENNIPSKNSGQKHVHGPQCNHGSVKFGSPSLVKDPVCGMDVDPSTSKLTFAYDGQTFYFCNPK